MTHPHLTLELPDEHATDALGYALAHLAADLTTDSHGKLLPGPAAGGRIHLKGDLGSGKTALVRALLRQCNISGRIKSPSYALLESYKVSNLYFYHLDFYRFSEDADWLDAGFRDLFKNNALILIEWPERAGTLLSDPDLLIELSYAGLGRIVTLSAYSEKGLSWINALPPLLMVSRQTHER
jgi:tRNA threonylcarbamoyladenosine biosynthesis protein TsaE